MSRLVLIAVSSLVLCAGSVAIAEAPVTRSAQPAVKEPATVGLPPIPGFRAPDGRHVTYPATRADSLVETRFGEKVADPYRWLENDIRGDAAVAEWVARQNAVTDGYLDQLPQRAWFGKRIRELLDYERFGLPQKAGKRYFYTRNSGLQNQAQLFVRTGLSGKPRLLIDPNTWAKDGATALDGWEPSQDGKLLAYLVQDGGSDWRTIRVIDTGSGKVLPDEIKWAKFTGLSWVGNAGFLYSRFPEPKAGEAYQSLNRDHAVWFHKVGTPQSEDRLVYATPEHPEYGHHAEVTHDGRWIVVTTSHGTDARNAVHVMRLTGERWGAVQSLVSGLENDWRLIEGMGDTLYFVTNRDAPRLRVVSVDLNPPVYKCNNGVAHFEVDCRDPVEFRPVVPERAETLERARIVGDRLILNYLKDAASVADVVSLDGKPVQRLALNAIGTASGFTGRPGDPETFFSFSSFNQPAGIFRYDTRSGKIAPFVLPKVTFNPDDYLVEQRFYESKDGTKVPMFLVRNKAAAAAGKAMPTLLYGYGGFDVALTPTFSATRMAWLEAGGAFAMANLRGGGEYGKAWHDAGRLHNKQNVFDDFIAAGEYLIAEGITPKGGLTVQGGSNGGLLVGAVVNQRPDLFAAANPAVGVMDMLRFNRFTAGRYWVDDYGYPDREADFRVLRAYSPYHNIASGKTYPAVLVTTADTDDRVVPGHSFKYAAALQAAEAGD